MHFLNWIVCIAGFLSGVIGAMGLGGGGVLLIYLTVFADTPQLSAQGINLLFFLPIGALSVIIYSIRKEIKWKTVLFMWLGGILGVAAGFFAAKAIDTFWLSKIFAVLLILFGCIGFFRTVGTPGRTEQKTK